MGLQLISDFNRFLALLILSVFTCLSCEAQGVNKPGAYPFTFYVKNCFDSLHYQPGVKNYFQKANYIYRGQRIWRSIALENKQNFLTLATTSDCTEVGLLEIIKFGLLEKKLQAFLSDDFSGMPLSSQEIVKALSFYDSTLVITFDPAGSEKQEQSITKRYLFDGDVKTYLLKEDWIINSNTGKTEKYIIGFAPLIYYPAIEKTLPLFWLYYGEWTNFLKCFEAKNFYFYDKISFDAVFTKRYFISQISKTSNVFNRSQRSINRGEDAQIESELIQEKLNNVESNLFQY